MCVKTPSNTVSILPNSHIELFKQGAGAGGGGLRPTKTPPPPGVNVPASFFFSVHGKRLSQGPPFENVSALDCEVQNLGHLP